MSFYPKTSAKIARDIDLLDFVFGRDVAPTLEDVQFARDILGVDFKLSGEHLDCVFECDAVDILDHLLDGRIVIFSPRFISVAREDLPDRSPGRLVSGVILAATMACHYGALECLKYLQEKHNLCPQLCELLLFSCARNGHAVCLRHAIENGAVCDARALLESPTVQSEYVVQYLRTLVPDYAPDEETEGRIRCAQSALDDVSGHVPEGTYLQTMNALGEAHRRVRPRRGD